MTTIQLQITDDIVNKYGIKAVINRLQQYLEAEQLKILAEEIKTSIEMSGENNDTLVNQARKKAWDEYKIERLKNILP